MRLFILIALCAVVWATGLSAAPVDFRLTEQIGHHWQREPVTFPLTAAQLRQVNAGQVLMGPQDTATPYQLVDGDTRKPRIAFQVDLPPYATQAFTFSRERASHATELPVQVIETPDTLAITNGKTGIRVAKRLANGQGPIAGIRLTSGAWVTGSRLATDQPITHYEALVTATGPVFAEITCRATIGNAATWEQRYRIYANEPVVLVDETSHVDGPAATFSLDLNKDFTPDTMHYRYGKAVPGASYGKSAIWKLHPGEGEVYYWEAWLRWHERERQGNYFGLYREDGNDLLGLAAREAGAWVDPSVPAEKRAARRQFLLNDAQGLHVDFPLKIGQRKWMYIALPKEPCLAETKDETIAYHSPLPYTYLVKYGHFPLDMVKDYVLQWDASKDVYPRLLITPKDVARFRAGIKDRAAFETAVKECLEEPVAERKMQQPIMTYYATQDAQLGAHIFRGAQAMMRSSMEVLLEQNGLPYGSAPHMDARILMPTMMLSDVALSTGQGTPEERQHLLSQLAFIGYALNRPEYWSPERGHDYTANMTTMVACYRMAAGALLTSHPRSQEWVNAGLSELKHEVMAWSDENGGWLESPHYALVSYDLILSGLLMAYNSTGDDTLFSPRMRQIAEWFGKITTPPDSRFGGFRHLPIIGHVYINEPTGEFGVLAYLWKDRDPVFSAKMQWLYQQHRSHNYPGIGGPYPGTDGFRGMLTDAALPATAPAYHSEFFPQSGVVLRNVYDNPHETLLYLIAGTHHDHYDRDSGSITLWGKGRILCDDFGYYSYAPADEHNLVESPVIDGGSTMQMTTTALADRLDYLRGTRQGWTRQIAFVKRPDPLAPNYFVLCDSMEKPAPMLWHLWFTANRVTPNAQGAVVEGKDDVDTDVIIVRPTTTAFTTDTKTVRANYGMDAEGKGGAMSTTQLGLFAKFAEAKPFTVVLYPRLKTEAAPVCSPIADGKGMKIQTIAGTDYVFLSPTPFTYQEGDISFTGTAGMIQRTANDVQLALGAPGKLSVGAKVITRE